MPSPQNDRTKRLRNAVLLLGAAWVQFGSLAGCQEDGSGSPNANANIDDESSGGSAASTAGGSDTGGSDTGGTNTGGGGSGGVPSSDLDDGCEWLRPMPNLEVRVPGGADGRTCRYSMTAVINDGSADMACSAAGDSCRCSMWEHPLNEIQGFELLQDGLVVETWSPPFEVESADADCPAPPYADWRNGDMGGAGGMGGAAF